MKRSKLTVQCDNEACDFRSTATLSVSFPSAPWTTGYIFARTITPGLLPTATISTLLGVTVHAQTGHPRMADPIQFAKVKQ